MIVPTGLTSASACTTSWAAFIVTTVPPVMRVQRPSGSGICSPPHPTMGPLNPHGPQPPLPLAGEGEQRGHNRFQHDREGWSHAGVAAPTFAKAAAIERADCSTASSPIFTIVPTL